MRERYSEPGRNPYDGLRPYSAITHGAGIILAILALITLLQLTIHRDMITVTAVSIYAVSMLCLYTASTIYHSLNVGIRGRSFLRKLDHLMIYFLIAGSYTPVCLISLNGTISGRVMLTIIWSMALSGSIFTLFWIKMPRFLTALIYLIMGWVAVFAIYPLYSVMSSLSFIMLMTGGAFYTVGGILYALKWPGRDTPYFGCHEIFHLFIIFGSICHFIMIYQSVC